ncbi:MAG: hypothetical protein IKK75_05345 [Clostridia bacterium]|nr:hypothetical protein [Clostridia bacterium]
MGTRKICVLDENKVCDGCGECDRCDLDPSKVCDNCMRCLGLDGNSDYRAITISGILMNEEDAD